MSEPSPSTAATALSRLIEKRIRADVQSMSAYAVQDARGLVKLDAMENPYALPAELQAALGQRLGALELHRYPNAQHLQRLSAALLTHAQPPADCAIMLGNGSDELISLLAMACARAGETCTILAPSPGFVMYALSAQLQGQRFVGVDLLPDFNLDLPAMLAAIAEHKPAITYLAYPNNPTANLWQDSALEQIVQACADIDGLVVFDEAYQPFAAQSYIQRMAGQAHVLLIRTLSKFGLAGVRIGYMLGQPELIKHIDKVRPPYNISVLNAECALFALEHGSVFAAQAQQICAQRERMQHALAKLPGCTPYPSQANMILLRTPDARADFTALRESGILVKDVSKMHPLLHNCLRLTVGTEQENQRVLAALAARYAQR